jgi:anti-sigma regulatory factor (Ser/Thr protein kinase)
VTDVLRLRLPLTRVAAKRMRSSIAGLLAKNGVPATAAREVLLAADEAFINAFMHSGDVAGLVDVRAEVRADRVIVEIRDRGCGFDPRSVDVKAMPDPLATHGRGLFLMHHLMDDVEVRSPGRSAGTLVRMVKGFSRRRATVVGLSD